MLAAALVLALAAPEAGAQKQRRGAPAKAKKLYCWTDNGHTVCGDTLPADAAGRARTEINPISGLRTGEVARALTDAERAEAATAAAEAARLAEVEAARLRRDLAMVESYATETELRTAFQARFDLLDETIKASQLGVSNLRLTLLGLLRRAGELELANKPVPATMANNVATQHAELRRRQVLLAQQLRERATLDGELAGALERYRAMKNPGAAAATAPPGA